MTRKTHKFEYKVLEKILKSNVRSLSVRNFEYRDSILAVTELLRFTFQERLLDSSQKACPYPAASACEVQWQCVSMCRQGVQLHSELPQEPWQCLSRLDEEVPSRRVNDANHPYTWWRPPRLFV